MIAGFEARTIGAHALSSALRDSHQHAWDLLADLSPSQWTVDYHEGINPPLWELAHMAWFTEWWVLRQPAGHLSLLPSRLPGADALFDSSKIAHRARWNAPMPAIDTIRSYVAAVLEDVEKKLASDHAPDLYFFRLALFHADMHGEALTYLRQTLDLSPLAIMTQPKSQMERGYADCAGGEWEPPVCASTSFAFDNELPAPAMRVAPFSIARRCITYGEFVAFVNEGGYQRKALWSELGWQWKLAARLDAPARWRPAVEETDIWQERWFGSWRPLEAELPVCHVNAFEAEAYCTWAKLRLPTEGEWQWAASHDEIAWGDSVWEWVSDTFSPFEGFIAGPYREYSAPWFDSHRVLRGAAFATHPRMQHPRYRNFYLPERNDVFAGFRTCRL